jgi:hypothetical protein
MDFIELHYKGNPRLIALNRISALGCDEEDTFIWLTGDSDCLYIDESYDDIKNKLRKVGFIWNV